MTPPGGWRRALLVVAAVVAVAATAVFANLTLLDATGEDGLGRLNQNDPALIGAGSPAAVTSPGTTAATRTATAPADGATTTARTSTDGDDHSGADLEPGDDSGGHGRGRGR